MSARATSSVRPPCPRGPTFDRRQICLNCPGARARWGVPEEAVLGSANLQEADLDYADLQGANLVGANLQGANLPIASLQGKYVSSTSVVGQQRKSSVGLEMSALGGKADLIFGRPDVCS